MVKKYIQIMFNRMLIFLKYVDHSLILLPSVKTFHNDTYERFRYYF